eukprot:PhM_4_TR10074/c0_g1_i1/m.46851
MRPYDVHYRTATPFYEQSLDISRARTSQSPQPQKKNLIKNQQPGRWGEWRRRPMNLFPLEVEWSQNGTSALAGFASKHVVNRTTYNDDTPTKTTTTTAHATGHNDRRLTQTPTPNDENNPILNMVVKDHERQLLWMATQVEEGVASTESMLKLVRGVTTRSRVRSGRGSRSVDGRRSVISLIETCSSSSSDESLPDLATPTLTQVPLEQSTVEENERSQKSDVHHPSVHFVFGTAEKEASAVSNVITNAVIVDKAKTKLQRLQRISTATTVSANKVKPRHYFMRSKHKNSSSHKRANGGVSADFDDEDDIHLRSSVNDFDLLALEEEAQASNDDESEPDKNYSEDGDVATEKSEVRPTSRTMINLKDQKNKSPPRKEKRETRSKSMDATTTKKNENISSNVELTEDDVLWAKAVLEKHHFRLETAVDTSSLDIRNCITQLTLTHKATEARDLRRALTVARTLVLETTPMSLRNQFSSLIAVTSIGTSLDTSASSSSPRRLDGGRRSSRRQSSVPRVDRIEGIARVHAWRQLAFGAVFATEFLLKLQHERSIVKMGLLFLPLVYRWLRKVRLRQHIERMLQAQSRDVNDRPTREQLRSMSPLMRSLYDEELDAVISALTLTGFPPYATIWHKGEVSRCLYILISGSVVDRLVAESDPEAVEVTAGAVIGAGAIVMGIAHEFSASAGKMGVVAWSMTDSVFKQCLLSSYRFVELAEQLQSDRFQEVFTMYPLTTAVLRSSCPSLRDAPESIVRDLVRYAMPANVARGRVWRLHSKAKCVLVVASGRLEEKEEDGEEAEEGQQTGRVTATYHIGDCVGWLECLFAEFPRRRSLVAPRRCVVWSIPFEDFYACLQNDQAYHQSKAKAIAIDHFVQRYVRSISANALRVCPCLPLEPRDPQLEHKLATSALCQLFDKGERFISADQRVSHIIFVAEGTVEVTASSVSFERNRVVSAPKWLGVEHWIQRREKWCLDLTVMPTSPTCVVYSIPISVVRHSLVDFHQRRDNTRQQELISLACDASRFPGINKSYRVKKV